MTRRVLTGLRFPLQLRGRILRPNIFGSFTLQLQAYNGGTLLGTVTESGVSTSTSGTALSIGALDKTGTEHHEGGVHGTAAPTTDFAIGTMYLGTPEPRTLVLLGSGPLGLAGFARRRMSKCFRKATALSSRSARTDIKDRLSRRPFCLLAASVRTARRGHCTWLGRPKRVQYHAILSLTVSFTGGRYRQKVYPHQRAYSGPRSSRDRR